VAEYLRFTADEYESVARACRPLSLNAPFRAFQRSLVDALLLNHPVMAARIAGLHEQQVCLLLCHLKDQRESPSERPIAAADQAACELSFQEWRTIAHASALVALREDSLPSFKGRFLQEIAHAEPGLAARLARLSEGQVLALYEQVKAGKRWKP